jgi:quinol monooxygenase YgiN
VLKKAAYDTGGTIWTAATAPIEYLRVQHYAKWEELDVTRDPKLKEQSETLTRISSRIMQCTDRSERIIEEILPDLSLPAGKDIPKIVRVLTIQVKPDKIGEFLALQKDDVLPAVKKAGAKDYTVSRVRLGAPTSMFVIVTGMNSWADMSARSPISAGMSQDGYRQFLTKTTSMQVESEYNVYRHMPDLSYLPAGN